MSQQQKCGLVESHVWWQCFEPYFENSRNRRGRRKTTIRSQTLFISISLFLNTQLICTDAVPVLGLTDPRLCYLLDGFLFIYAIIMTALFVKAKLSQASKLQLQPGQEDVYNKLSRGQRDEYDVLGAKRGADPELGGRHQQRRKNPQDTVYTSLQKDKMGEAYSEIGMKGEQRRRAKGNEGLYQGLSTATKDTYDALQMQPLPPR
ncbi:PREDICTED: T-cell surface glycoprotein CD3 zeta chain [Merops nubicus]|nr:PREDICTED: T-cell surface glycoprotein CD3 zeta chain [Merops nubicus]